MEVKKSDKRKEVEKLLGRTKLRSVEKSMFDLFWNDSEFRFGKDERGLLSTHRIDR